MSFHFFQVILAFCIISLCAAATTQTKVKPTSKSKDVKEKRDAAVVNGPYSYEAPQKSFQVPIHAQQQQQKAAPIEYHHSSPKAVAPLDYYQPTQNAPIHIQPQPQYHHEAPQFTSSYGYPTAVESLFSQQEQPIKGYGEYSFAYPSFESFSHMPYVHYNQDLNKINAQFVDLSEFKAPSISGYKAAQYQPSFSFGSPAPAYSFPSHSYSAPQQQHQQQQHAYIPSYHSVPSAPSHPQPYGFSQSPSAIFVPQTISISPKPIKTPDYASGTKGLSHFSTISSVGAPEQSYYKQQYEIPQYTQTERPFKASHYVGSSHVDSHSEQSIANAKPSGEYLPPSKQYLPAKEQYQPVKEQYLPPKEQYLPAKEQYVTIKEQYVPTREQYAPSRQHYMPEHGPVEYQIQYVQAPSPSKAYIPPVANNYLPPKATQEPPKTYLPASPPKSSYLPPKNSYLPPSQPTKSYLPPNNPYHSISHSAPSHQFQQYQPQDSYESLDYQSQSGHK